MNLQSIIAELRQEASRVEQAIAALAGLGSQPARRGRPPKSSQAKSAGGRKRFTMSAAARAKIAAAQKARWAKQKGKAAPKRAKPAQKKASAQADESCYAEEVVGDDEGSVGCEEEGGLTTQASTRTARFSGRSTRPGARAPRDPYGCVGGSSYYAWG